MLIFSSWSTICPQLLSAEIAIANRLRFAYTVSMTERHRLVQQLVSQAASLAEDVAFGQIVFHVRDGKVVRAEVKESILPQPGVRAN